MIRLTVEYNYDEEWYWMGSDDEGGLYSDVSCFLHQLFPNIECGSALAVQIYGPGETMPADALEFRLPAPITRPPECPDPWYSAMYIVEYQGKIHSVNFCDTLCELLHRSEFPDHFFVVVTQSPIAT